MQNGAVLLQVIDAQSFALRKTIRFDDASAQGLRLALTTHIPTIELAHPLRGATMAVLAIDTDRDEIKRVIRLDEIAAAWASSPTTSRCPTRWAGFRSSQNRLNIAHLDGSFVSVYDLAKGHFLSPLIPLTATSPTGCWPTTTSASF